MKKQITINKEWLERLVEIKDDVVACSMETERSVIHKLNYLLGYISSAESMLEE